MCVKQREAAKLLRWGWGVASQQRWGSREVTHEGGHLWGHLIQPRPQGQLKESWPEAPKTRQGNAELGPFGPAWTHHPRFSSWRETPWSGTAPGLPDSAGSDPRLGKDERERTGPYRVWCGGATGKRRGRGLQAGPAEGGYPRILPQPSRPELRWPRTKTLFGEVTSGRRLRIRRARLRTAAPEAATSALTSAAARSSRLRGRGVAWQEGACGGSRAWRPSAVSGSFSVRVPWGHANRDEPWLALSSLFGGSWKWGSPAS